MLGHKPSPKEAGDAAEKVPRDYWKYAKPHPTLSRPALHCTVTQFMFIWRNQSGLPKDGGI